MRIDADEWARNTPLKAIPLHWWVPIITEIKPNDRVVELGCGAGNTALHMALAHLPLDLTLVDFSSQLLDEAAHRFKIAQAQAPWLETPKFVLADIMDEGFVCPEADVIYSVGLLEHFQDDEIVKILERLRDQARCVVTVIPNSKCKAYMQWMETRKAAGTWPYGDEFPKASLSQQYEEAGYGGYRQSGMGPSFYDEDTGETYLLMCVGYA